MKGVRWHWRKKDGGIIGVTLATRKMKFVDDDGAVRDVYMALVTNVDEKEPVPANEAFPRRRSKLK